MSTTSDSDTNELGKRYECATCGTEVMCTKRGGGRFHCHDAPMAMKAVKPLPTSD